MVNISVEEMNFRKSNRDCFIPEDFSQLHREYASLPVYLRRWCVYKDGGK